MAAADLSLSATGFVSGRRARLASRVGKQYAHHRGSICFPRTRLLLHSVYYGARSPFTTAFAVRYCNRCPSATSDILRPISLCQAGASIDSRLRCGAPLPTLCLPLLSTGGATGTPEDGLRDFVRGEVFRSAPVGSPLLLESLRLYGAR